MFRYPARVQLLEENSEKSETHLWVTWIDDCTPHRTAVSGDARHPNREVDALVMVFDVD